MICFQENPFEINLSYSISGCIRQCPGCHSPFLQNDVGDFVEDVLQEDIDLNKTEISCVIFMGGDDSAHIDNLLKCAEIVHKNGLKTCLYTGADKVNQSIIDNFDYIKIGPYIESLGGLKSEKTNQKFYVNKNKVLIDKTEIFHRR